MRLHCRCANRSRRIVRITHIINQNDLNQHLNMNAAALDDQLECEALESNQRLLAFDIKSNNIDWQDFVIPLKKREEAPAHLQQYFPLISHHREPADATTSNVDNRREILVCHDMLGNYREDRFYRSSKKFDEYRFYHWSGIDYFCYFSHRYITIPPCVWINAAHQHGVRILGTFIAEGFRGSRLLHEVLISLEMIDEVVNALVRLCKHFRFEGWLVNIECKVEPASVENLFYFIERLRLLTESNIDSGHVFWYDSLVESGDLMWQNEINTKNLRFFKSASATLVNYAWNDKSLEATVGTCERENLDKHRAFFGIDVFGRGQIAKFQTKRTLARLKAMSVCIFGPGWTFETLQQFGYNINQANGDEAVNEAFLERNDKFWWSLWDQLVTHPFDSLPFYSDLCLGSGKYRYDLGKPTNDSRSSEADSGRFFNLSLQSLQPSVPLYQLAERFYGDAFNGGSSLRILQYDSSFRVFVTNFQVPQRGLICSYAYKLAQRDGEFDCVVRLSSPDNNTRDCYMFLGEYFDTTNVLQKGRCYISPFKAQYAASILDGTGLESPRIPKDLKPSQANGWQVRYYVVAFDGAVRVKDIGVLYRRTRDAIGTAYLGAVYVNEFDISTYEFPLQSNFALINLYEKDLFN